MNLVEWRESVDSPRDAVTPLLYVEITVKLHTSYTIYDISTFFKILINCTIQLNELEIQYATQYCFYSLPV
jgi:hypothetical protein